MDLDSPKLNLQAQYSSVTNVVQGYKESPSNYARRKAAEKFDSEAVCL